VGRDLSRVVQCWAPEVQNAFEDKRKEGVHRSDPPDRKVESFLPIERSDDPFAIFFASFGDTTRSRIEVAHNDQFTFNRLPMNALILALLKPRRYGSARQRRARE